MYFEQKRMKLPAHVVEGNKIDTNWLKRASPEEQHEALFQWFTNQYEDPVESLPYDSGEGGYIPIHGALVDPFDEFGEFGDIVSDDVIEGVAKELFDIGGDAWSPIPSIHDFYDIEGQTKIEERAETKETAFNKFKRRLSRSLELLKIKDDFLIKTSVFSLLFTAFETYLWEKTKECLDDEKLNLEKNLIQNISEFKDKKMTLAELYLSEFDFRKRLEEILDGELVWHNINTIDRVFKSSFELSNLPSFNDIQRDLNKRHDIVHRFGMDSNGYEMPLTKDDILNLETNLMRYVQELEQNISDKLSN